ncbi:TonB-dependent receptor [Salinibacter sp.]|uniref:TonB-dependent receptor n=1 Tax=Salinibacter sp. TaxID=2065818 RepID=UPI0021E74AC5|nr:TonB-dependent receptor [Salinibacter sp.]
MSESWMRRLVAAALIVLMGIGPHAAVAQDAASAGVVTGVVVEKQRGAPLPGANVTIEGTTTGTSTDLDGRYRIDDLEPGTYNLVVSFVGFQQKTVTGVDVTAGETTTLDVALAGETEQLDEVVVQAQAARDSEAGLLKKRARAATVMDAISAETIGKSASSTAASAIKKVTGASVTDGTFVNVRGLGGRYVNAQLNGAELPSASPNTNSVPLDLFPAGLLDNIVTSKTFTPDKPGNYTGGNVNLSTKSFPDERTLSFSTSVTYNSEVQFDTVLRPDGGLDEIPAMVPSLPEGELTAENQPIPPYFGANQQEQQFLDEVTRAFSKGKVTPQRRSGPINQGYSASYGDQFQVFGDTPLGLVTGVTYSRSTSASRDRRSAAAGAGGRAGVSTEFRLTGESGSTEEVLGGIANFTLNPHPNHQLSFNTLYNRSEQKSAVFLSGRIPRDDDSRTFNRRRIEPIDRTVWNLQAKGEHMLGSDGSNTPRLTWSSSYSQTTQDESDVRFFTDDFLPERKVHRIALSVYEAPTRYFRNLKESTWSNDLSVSVPFGPGSVEVGGSYLRKERDLEERRFVYGNLDSPNYEGAPDTYFGECIGLIGTDGCDTGPYQNADRPDLGVVIQERTANQNNLAGNRTAGGGFAMVDTDVPGVADLRFIGGLRAEYTDQFVETRDGQTGRIETTDLLPSANLVYALRENMNVRAAYGRTIARPTFREFSPSTYYDFQRQEIFDGSPNLERTLVHNLDLRWEWFTGPGELFAVSGYFKSFDAPIERVVVEQAINREVTYQNQQSAQVYGVEIEARKRLGFLADPLRHLEVGGNLTLTESSVTDASGQDLGRPLEGQSPYLINADVSYDHPELGTTVSVFYNYFDDRLDTIERENQPDQYERGRHTIDVVATQALPFGVEMKGSVKNLLNEETEIYQDFSDNAFTTVRYRTGRTISVGFTYNL